MLLQTRAAAAEPGRFAPAQSASQPAVDVIVPFRNEEGLLPDKLANLLALDYPHPLLRFFLVDGQSTDRSLEIVERTARADSRFVVLRSSRADKTQQINLALLWCTAPWILLTDVDAELPEATLKELLNVASADPQVGVAGVLHQPRRATCLDRWHWRAWNTSRRLERRLGSTSAVLAPCYLLRRGWLPHLPDNVVADDLYVSFAALAAGLKIALAETLVVERRAPLGTLAVLFHKVRKGRAFLREVFRFLPAARRMPSPMRELFLWRAAATLAAPPLILGTVAASLALAPAAFAAVWAVPLACCLAPTERLSPWRGWRRVAAGAAVVGWGLLLAGVLCVALASLPFFRQRASFSRWRQEER